MNRAPIHRPARIAPAAARTATPAAVLWLVVCLLGLGPQPPAAAQQDDARPNVLLIMIDDLRPDLPVYGVDHVNAPHLEALAAQSRVFRRHYVNTPTCGASRYNIISGMYPRRQVQRGNNAIRQTQEEWVEDSLPALMRAGGYRTYAVGKVTHYVGGLAGPRWAQPPEELPGVWDRTWTPTDPWTSPEALMHGYANGVARERGVSLPVERVDGPDHTYPDAFVADEAIEHLNELAGSGEPWFFAVGLLKPHLPFAAPDKYFQLYDIDDIPPPPNPDRPQEPSGWHGSGEFFNNYGRDPRNPNEDEQYRQELRLAYAACISYMDAQLGRVMAALEESGQADHTVVVLWSDHGFCLGDHAIWGKHCLYELALWAPLMIRVPGQPAPGELADGLVETVDVLPTILDLVGLPASGSTDGVSLAPMVADPAAPGKPAVFGFWGRQETIRTDDWRLIRHRRDGGRVTFELFDHRNDPHETTNMAADRPELVEELNGEIEALMQRLGGG